MRGPAHFLWPFGVVLAGCTGIVSAPASPDDGAHDLAASPAASPETGSVSAPLTCSEGPRDPGPAPLRMLSRAQYLNTLRDLFGARGDVSLVLASVPAPSAFGLLQADISQRELEDFAKAASTVATAVVQDKNTLSSLVPCSDTDRRACALAFVQSFGARAYRAPLADADDLARHLALYDVGARTSHEHGIELLLQGMLQSPRFLYQVELGTEDAVNEKAVRLSGHELAARLSYAFWQSPPDDELIRAAETSELDDPDALAQQLARMLAHEKGQHALRSFLETLVHLPALDQLVKDPAVFPEWQASQLSSVLRAQASTFFDYVLAEEDGSLDALLTSRAVFANEALSTHYPDAPRGSAFARITVASGQASGLLTLPAFLALQAKPDESSPIYRGKFVREALLCQDLPSPPANIPKPPEVSAGASTRERLAQHEADPACSGCHRLLDPIGFGLEHFDAIGRYRAEDGGKPVNDRGEITASADADGPFEGVLALGQRLAASAEVEECVARQWFRFALGRFEQPVDGCTIDDLHGQFADADNSLLALPRAIVETDAFRFRRPRVLEEP